MRHLYYIALSLLLLTPLKSSAGEKIAPAEGLVIEKPTHNFGTHERRSKDLTHTFTFTNKGERPLILLRCNTSCSCIKVEYPRHPIAPGKGGEIKVTYEIRKRESGVFAKVIELYANDKEGAHLITIQGNSTER
ncbi:MAG: DUF1573 domain-containing protein [Rikenellaceae bacterium]